MRTWERTLLLVLTLAVLALLARVSFSPAAYAIANAEDQEYIIAVCATPSIINELMASDRFAPARENVLPDARKDLEDLRDELGDLQDRLDGADPSDPGAQRDRRRAREAVNEYQRLQQQIGEAVEAKTAEQLAECFAMVRSSASAVAEHLGYEYVISTGDPEEELSKTNSEVTLRQITARPVLRAPKKVDITDDVRDDLKLE